MILVDGLGRQKSAQEISGAAGEVETFGLPPIIDTMTALQVAKLDERTTILSKVVEKLSDKIDSVEEKLSDKIEAVEEKLAGKIDANHKELTGKIDATHKEITAVQQMITSLKTMADVVAAVASQFAIIFWWAMGQRIEKVLGAGHNPPVATGTMSGPTPPGQHLE